ncbi:hypothetical protein [Maribacter aestuarii]|uniref:hypothetical protein n=1 Tax=Maribacter aestuarii TaxID=1130723 RepID=UPI00248B96B9|nr:hypothetical protein [Maribacter aestuarii]
MSSSKKHWTKKELKIYLLLLCAQADSQQSQEEIALIKAKTDNDTFNRIYQEFVKDEDEDTRIHKIEMAVHKHEFSHMELTDLRKETNELFNSDKKYSAAERFLDKLLDNIIY